MGSYRIEESPNKRAGCSVKACKDNKVKIQKGEIRLGVWIETDRFQSWSWRHWGCLTPKVIANIRNALDEGGVLNFDLLDGFEELPAQMQDKVRKAIEDGEVAEADRTVAPGETAGEDVPNGDDKTAEKPKAETKTKAKTKKRSRADSEEAEQGPSKKTNGTAAAKEKNQEEKPAKRTKVRKAAAEEPVKEPEEPVRKTRGRKKKAEPAEDEGDAAGLEKQAEASPPIKKARGKKTAANGDKPKRGRPKRAVSDDE
ncbi:hypothetical protein UA08_04021 [Talaromyces atroroseus]|uniref:PARP-type domain-containing protein n=1 Tax=Talaromyces atroroseus TaxID=1441469 RepID=A0A1Q5Q962_TALAT|nr:hypothetical protein UA08_04021 [Talaromyces atroroseus]OKL60667.1 hypothetical protein UA08_04021 [Talaromyces atroroseus]